MGVIDSIPETDATRPSFLPLAVNGRLDEAWQRSPDNRAGDYWSLFTPVSYAMQAMIVAARAAGVMLDSTGRYRSLARQEDLFLARFTPGPFDPAVHRSVPSIVRRVWNGREWFLRKGMAMAATPGTSNHGWGIADDLALDPDDDNSTPVQGVNEASLVWLRDNAGSFGFALDIHEEPWHWHWVGGDTLSQRTVDVLAAEGVAVPDLSAFDFTVPAPTPPEPVPEPLPPPPEVDTVPLYIARDIAGRYAVGDSVRKIVLVGDDDIAFALARAERAGQPLLDEATGKPVTWTAWKADPEVVSVVSASAFRTLGTGG